MSVVGKIRLNGQVTPSSLVARLRSRFTEEKNFDLIEIFNNSIPNDPSPPSKALAVIHRSPTLVTVVFQRVLDYNNRDFYKSQIQRLTDDIAENCLRENKNGGIQLTVMRDPAVQSLLRDDSVVAKLNRYLNSARNRVDRKFSEIFSKSTEINGHRNWKEFFEMRFFIKPFLRLNVEAADGEKVTVVRVDRRRSTVYAVPTDGHESISRSEFDNCMQRVLREHKCVEGALVFDNPVAETETNYYHSFTINQRPVGGASPLHRDSPFKIDDKFIVPS